MTETAPQLQPLYLLAASQLLFWKRQDRVLLERLDEVPRVATVNVPYEGRVDPVTEEGLHPR